MALSSESAPRVSLVATVRDEAACLAAWLSSIDAQTRPPDEVVVVDGGSTDGTFEALQHWAAHRPSIRVFRAPGANIAAGRNLAIRHSKGSLIAVTDAGVVLDPRWLDTLIQPLEAGPRFDVVAGFFVAAPQSHFERALGATTLPVRDEIDPDGFLPSSRSVAFRRAAWAAVGGYPEWLDYGEDVVFDLALRRAGCRFAWAPSAIVAFRPRPSLGAFFLQYYRYARGDGKAGLWRHRHAIRYSTYLVGLPLAWWARRHPLAVAAVLTAAALYVRRPALRLLTGRQAPASRTQGDAPGCARPAAPTGSLILELLLIPLIRLVGDLAKMLGYPVGLVWRWRHAGLVPR